MITGRSASLSSLAARSIAAVEARGAASGSGTSSPGACSGASMNT